MAPGKVGLNGREVERDLDVFLSCDGRQSRNLAEAMRLGTDVHAKKKALNAFFSKDFSLYQR